HGLADTGLLPNQTPRREKAHANQAELKPAALGRSQPIGERSAGLPFYRQPRFARTREFHLRWILVLNHQRQIAWRAIRDVNPDLGFGSDGEATAEVPLDAHAIR